MDEADHAQIAEDRERAVALANVLSYDPGEPVQRGGVRYCADCADVISDARLTAWPAAVRCTDCQGIFEQRNRDAHAR